MLERLVRSTHALLVRRPTKGRVSPEFSGTLDLSLRSSGCRADQYCARLAQILDLFGKDSWRISNDVGRCQDTPSPFRPPEPALNSKESAEAAVALSPRFSMSTLRARSVSLHHDGVCTKHLFGHLRTMMTRANSLHAREAGRPINVSVTRGPTPTQAFPHTHRAYDCRARPRRQNSA